LHRSGFGNPVGQTAVARPRLKASGEFTVQRSSDIFDRNVDATKCLPFRTFFILARAKPNELKVESVA